MRVFSAGAAGARKVWGVHRRGGWPDKPRQPFGTPAFVHKPMHSRGDVEAIRAACVVAVGAGGSQARPGSPLRMHGGVAAVCTDAALLASCMHT